MASPDESERADPFSLGEPRFDLPLSGWYWQITRLDKKPPEVKGSTSLFGSRLNTLAQAGVKARVGELREGYTIGPDERRLRVVERVIDLGDDGRFLIQVAADCRRDRGDHLKLPLGARAHLRPFGSGAGRHDPVPGALRPAAALAAFGRGWRYQARRRPTGWRVIIPKTFLRLPPR